MEPHVDPAAAPMSPERMQVRFGEMTPQVLRFYARLTRLPIGAWSEVARLAVLDPVRVPLADGPPVDDGYDHAAAEAAAAARARLRAVMDTMPGPLERAKRLVLTLANIAQGMVHPSVHARMRQAALTAVLALVARPQLSEDDFALLYAPFAELIPAAELDPDG